MNNLKKSIMSVAMAAITAASPILSSYVAYASDITVNDDGTVTQVSTSTDSSMSKADETKLLFIKLKTAGGKVVLNEGEDQEQRIRLDKKMDGVEYIDVYDKNDVLISSESTKDNGYTYVYEAKADDAVNVKAKADEGYKVKLYELTDDSSGTEIAEDVGFDAGNKVDSFKYPVFMEYDKTVKIGFEKTESADDIAKDLSVNDEAGKDKADEQSKAEADTESEGKTGEKDEPKSEETEDLKSKDAKADEKTAAEVSNDKKSEDTEDSKTTEDADAPEKSEDLKDIDSNDKQNVSEEIAADNDLTVNTDDNKKDNEESDITVNDSSITKDDENAGEEPNESSSEDIMDNNERSEDAKDADSDNSDKNFVSDETSDSADKDTTMNGSETEGTEKAEEAGSQTDNAEDKIENDKQDTEQSYDISNLDNTIFASARLVVISDDAKNVSADSKYIIANYQNIYLIQYETVEDAMKAYVKYTDAGLTTEPDAALSAASEIDLSDSDAEQIKEEIKEDAVESSTPEIKADEIQATAPVETTDIVVNENENPLSSLNEESQAAPAEVSSKLIALIDTGVPDGNPHVVDRVSLIDNNLGASDSHGDDMLQGIITENKNARVLSIRVMGDDGKCTVSSVIAGIEYAISQHADIINLSLYARTNIANSVLKAEIEKAVESGITVVAAAGNDGADVKDYMPGSVDAAIVVASCDEFGNISASSNYGKTVDYKVVASSTSEAAAKLTGHIAGISGDAYNLPSYIFKSDEYADATEEPSIDASEDETMEAAETTYSKVKTDLIRPLIDVFLPSDWINKNDVDMVARQYATHYDKSSKKLSETQSFCMEPYKCSANYGDHTGHTKRMDTGTSYKDTTITKALYYLYGGPAFEDNAQSLSGKTVNFKDLIKSYGCSTGNEYYCTTHYIISWIWNGGSGSTAPKSGWASGVTSKGMKNLKAIVKALEDMPMPASEAKFNKSTVTAAYDATTQKRKTAKVTYKASRENKLTFTLPKGIKVIDAADEKEKTTIYGGTTFYFVVDDSKPKGSATIKATTRYPVEFRAYRTTDSGEDTQELAFSYQPTYKDLKIKLSWDGKPVGEEWKVQAKLKKINENKEGLEGALFYVYDNENLDEDPVGVLKTTANGESNILKIDSIPEDIKSYTLYCQEAEAPKGYATQDTVYPLTFEKTEFDKLYKADPNTDGELKTFGPDEGISNPPVTPSITPPITPPTGGLYIKKTSKAPDDIMNLKSYTLEGAEYKVTSSRDASFNATLTTNQGGYTNTVTLPDNSIPRHSDAVVDMKGNVLIPAKDWIEKVQTTYYIVETKAPNYHSVYKGSKTQSVTMPDDAGQTFEIPFVNEPLFCDDSLDIEKLGVKGEPVVGAVFKVQYFDANSANESDLVRTWYLKSDESGHVRMDNNHLDANNRSDDFFKYDGNIVIPIGGYLQITEIDAPAEYVVETEPVGIATTKDADFTLTYANQMKPWYEEYERCRINIKKYEPDGSTPIAGVEFELKFVKQAITPTSKMHPNFKRLLKEGETTVRHTDANGEVFFDNLDQGEYEITEIKTKPGMGLMKEKIKVTLPFTMTFNEALRYKNVKFSTAKEDINYTGKWYFYECTYEITNNQLFGMPMTGDDGKWKYGFIGFFGLSVISCGFVIYKQKKKKKEYKQNK